MECTLPWAEFLTCDQVYLITDLKISIHKTERNRKGVTAEFIIPVGDVKDTSLVEPGPLVRSHLQP